MKLYIIQTLALIRLVALIAIIGICVVFAAAVTDHRLHPYIKYLTIAFILALLVAIFTPSTVVLQEVL